MGGAPRAAARAVVDDEEAMGPDNEEETGDVEVDVDVDLISVRRRPK